MTSRFTWSDEQRAQAVPGATVVVHSGVVASPLRYTIHEVYGHGGGVSVCGGDVMLAWSCLDPDSLSVTPDARQLALGGIP